MSIAAIPGTRATLRACRDIIKSKALGRWERGRVVVIKVCQGSVESARRVRA
jgi:hypothetical protein